jgi:hypothetical protein
MANNCVCYLKYDEDIRTFSQLVSSLIIYYRTCEGRVQYLLFQIMVLLGIGLFYNFLEKIFTVPNNRLKLLVDQLKMEGGGDVGGV